MPVLSWKKWSWIRNFILAYILYDIDLFFVFYWYRWSCWNLSVFFSKSSFPFVRFFSALWYCIFSYLKLWCGPLSLCPFLLIFSALTWGTFNRLSVCVCVSFIVCSRSKTTQQRLCVIPIVAEMPPLLWGKIYVLFPWMESECQLVCVINTLHLGIEPQCQNLFIHIAHCQLSVSNFMYLSDLLKLNSICYASLYAMSCVCLKK